jgi:hypothetical protein
MGVKSMYDKIFHQRTIIFMLGNEKYIGQVIMQKTFVENHVTHEKKKNNGELPRYTIDDAHPAIIDRDTFEKVQARLSQRKITVQRTAFTSMIFCEVCGLNFQRCTKHYKDIKKKVMQCANKKHGQPCDCDTREIPENILESVTAEVLGLSEFDADIFKAKIKRIIVPSKDQLVYHFQNGKTVTREWKSTANTDWWTPERRAEQAARITARPVTDEMWEAHRKGTANHYAAHPERRQADRDRMNKFCAENPDWGKAQNERMLTAIAKKKAGSEGLL